MSVLCADVTGNFCFARNRQQCSWYERDEPGYDPYSHEERKKEMSNHNNNHANPIPPILLSIAGFDPSCGAGTAADLKTVAAHGCYGIAAITSLTVQNTQGVEDVQNTPSAALRAQLDALAKDSDIAAVKIGMLGNRANAVVVAEFLDAHKFAHVVHDPVMKSSSGTELLDAAGVKYLITELLKRSTVITPNVPEAEILTGLTIKDLAGMEAAARKIVEMGAHAVIVKGGHMERAVDVLFDGQEIFQLAGDRVKEESLHGTGCTFGAAVAAQLASGRSLMEAATLAKAYVMKAIEKSYPTGKGRTPLDHFFRHRIEPPARGIHEVPQHGMHPAAEPAAH
jgi:hydroxymethylpyrimidine kinase/phosphomethylpyrimidine kinase